MTIFVAIQCILGIFMLVFIHCMHIINILCIIIIFYAYQLQFVFVNIIILSYFQTTSAAKNREDYRIVQEIPSDSSDDQYSDDSDDEWLPENNRDIGDEDDEGDAESQMLCQLSQSLGLMN